MDRLLLSFLGVPSAVQGVALFQGTLAGGQEAAASEILARPDEGRAVVLLREIVEGMPADRLVARLRQTDSHSVISLRRTLFDPPHAAAPQTKTVMRGGLSFAELAMELAAALEKKDSEASAILLENAGVVSNEVCRSLRGGLVDPETVEPSKRDLALWAFKRANVFINQLARMLVDPNLPEFPDITHHPSPLDVQMLLRSVEDRGWVATEIFGRITILTAVEFKDFLLGKEERRIFHPSIKILSDVKVETAPAASVAPAQTAALPRPMVIPIVGDFPTAVIPHMEGALMLAPPPPAKLQDPTIPYKLLRRLIYRALSEERFEEAARIVENISNEFVLARLFDDLRMKIGDEANHLSHSQLFFANTAIYVGKMLDQMNPETVVSLLLVLNQHVRWHDQKALDQWLLVAFRAIRSRVEEGEFGAARRLPRLSIILGTLMEWEETRELAQRLLQTGLNRLHEAYGEIGDALEALHDHSEAFLSPFEIEASDAAKIYDESKAAAELDIPVRRRIFRGLAAMMGQRSPIAPHFDPPRKGLAGREAVFEKLLRKLEALEGIPKNLEAVSSLILFALPPADVWRLMEATTHGKETSPSQFLAELLIVQPTEVVLAFFSAWGRGQAEDEDVAKLGRGLVALWRTQGEVGQRLVTDVVATALGDDAAVAVLQRALSQHGSDDSLMWEQTEIYVGLAERLGEKINPYEIFVTTGVLRPGDLVGKYREMAMAQAMNKLENLDRFGTLDRDVFWTKEDHTLPSIAIEAGSGAKLPEEEQQSWRRTALETLVKLGADERTVVNYLVSQLEGPHHHLYYEALDRMGPRAQQILVRLITKSASEKLYDYEQGFRDEVISDRGVGYYKFQIPVTLMVNERTRNLSALIQKFPLSSRAMQRFLIERLQKETGAYEKEIEKQGHIDRIVAGEILTPPIVTQLAGLGDAAITALSIWNQNLTETKFHGGIGELPDPPTIFQKITPYLFPLLHLLELIGSAQAHDLLAAILRGIDKQNVYIERGVAAKRIILRALARLESKPGYDGPLAVAEYLNGDAEFMEKLEILGFLENEKPMFKPTAFENMPYAMKYADNPYLSRLLGEITSPEFYLFFIRALYEDEVKQRLYAHRHQSLEMGWLMGRDVTAIPAIKYIASDEDHDPNNFQRGIAVKTLFWYFRRAREAFLDVPDSKLLKKIVSGRHAAHALRPFLSKPDMLVFGGEYADPEDYLYFTSQVGIFVNRVSTPTPE